MKSYRRPRRFKKTKPFYLRKIFWWLLLFLILLAGFLYFLFFSPYLQIKNIQISGNQKIATSDLENILAQNYKKNFFFWQTQSIVFANLNNASKSIIEKFPAIESLKVSKRLPDSLFLTISERLPLAKFCEGSFSEPLQNCYFIDKNGVIFEQTDNSGLNFFIRSENINEQKLGSAVLDKKFLDSLLKIQAKVQEEAKITIVEYRLPPEKLIGITQESWQAYFDPQKDLLDQAENLSITYREKISADKIDKLEYIDLRFSKIYIKYR